MPVDGSRGRVEKAAYVQLSLDLIAHRRQTIIQLRDDQTVDDTVLRRLQAALDAEELRHTNPEPLE